MPNHCVVSGRNDGRGHLAGGQDDHLAADVLGRQDLDGGRRQNPGARKSRRRLEQEDRHFDRKARLKLRSTIFRRFFCKNGRHEKKF